MSTAAFSFVFDGEAVRGGEIDVTDLAPALLALGQAVKATGKIVLGPDADVSLKIRTMQHGSFEVFLNAVISGDVGLPWSMIKVFYASDDGKTALAVIQTLAGATATTAGVGKGVIWLLKVLKGRKILRQEKADGDHVKVVVDGDEFIVPLPVAQAVQDANVRAALEKAIAEPLERDGIDTVRVNTGADVVEVEKAEAAYFKASALSDTEFSSTYQKAFSIQTLSFKRGNKWRLHDGQGGRNVTMLDQNFMDRVDRSEIAFAKDDVLVCEVREVSSRTATGFKSQYEILKVIEHRPKSHQPKLI
ncbi:MAG: hypothetical protein K2X10_11645 [Hyphomicrobiales bacterium]|nr:hypothetical protein [Hyphomicrobiales bacterium]